MGFMFDYNLMIKIIKIALRSSITYVKPMRPAWNYGELCIFPSIYWKCCPQSTHEFDKFFFTRFQSWIHKTLWENMFECLVLFVCLFTGLAIQLREIYVFFFLNCELFYNEFANVNNETMKNFFFFFVYWFS